VWLWTALQKSLELWTATPKQAGERVGELALFMVYPYGAGKTSGEVVFRCRFESKEVPELLAGPDEKGGVSGVKVVCKSEKWHPATSGQPLYPEPRISVST
jgi:hypothetical protein